MTIEGGRSVIVALLLAGAAPAVIGGEAGGRTIYNRYCYFCHGYSGDARTVAASMLVPSPRDFTAVPLPRTRMLDAVARGRPGTAMQSFSGILSGEDMVLVVDFVRDAFMGRREINLRYHSRENGWTGDPEASPAAPFVTGGLLADMPAESLTAGQREGLSLYLSACITCHVPGTSAARASWRNEAVTFPEGNYREHEESHDDPVTQVFEVHEQAPALHGADNDVERGELIYRDNCAHCHALDGTGRHWIGSFLEPAPPDFTRARDDAGTRPPLEQLIAQGVPGTSMPAWRDVLQAQEIRALARYMQAVFPRYSRR